MQKNIKIISVIIIITLATIYFLSRTQNESRLETTSKIIPTKTVTPNTTVPTLAVTKKNDLTMREKQDSQKLPDTPKLQQGKLISTLSKDKVGAAPNQGGGVGITGVVFNKRGEALVIDRMNDKIALIVDEHTTKTLLSVSEKEFLKGLAETPSGDYLALVGDTSLDIIRFNEQGDKTKIILGIKPEHLNGMRLESVGESIFIYGEEKTYEVDASGKIQEFYGTPLIGQTENDRKNLDVTIEENGFVTFTIRDKNSAPLETKMLNEVHGNIEGVYRLNHHEVALVLESSPFTNDFNAQNPHYTIMRMGSDGEIHGEIKIPRLSELSIDRPIQIKDGKILQTLQTESAGLEIYEYKLP